MTPCHAPLIGNSLVAVCDECDVLIYFYATNDDPLMRWRDGRGESAGSKLVREGRDDEDIVVHLHQPGEPG